MHASGLCHGPRLLEPYEPKYPECSQALSCDLGEGQGKGQEGKDAVEEVEREKGTEGKDPPATI